MNKGLILILRAIGVTITDDDAKMIEGIIPQIPALLKNAWEVFNNNMQNINGRMIALETAVKELTTANEALRLEIEKNGFTTKP